MAYDEKRFESYFSIPSVHIDCTFYYLVLTAVRVGFEPTVPVRAHLHSKQAPSSTQPPHLVFILVVDEQSARLSSDVWRQAYVLKAWSR